MCANPRKLLLAATAGLLTYLAWPRYAATQTEPPRSALNDLTGTYRYHGGSTLALVAGDSALYAVISEAKYPLRPIGADRVINGPGDTIPFRRDGAGNVTGFSERGTFFERLSPNVDPADAQLVRARPLGAAPYAYRPPPALGDGIAVGGLATAGLDSSVAHAIVRGVVDGTYADLHGVLVYRHGRLVLEEYFHGYDRDRRHQLRSATKSFVSALVGIAIGNGALAGVDEPVLARLPYDGFANPHPQKQALTLHDLLTHRTGLACDDWNPQSPGNESRLMETEDWIKSFLDLPVVAERGMVARYCSAGTWTAGRMVERATGQPLPAYAQRALFDPLGIRPTDVRWNVTTSAENAGTFAQLNLRPRDLLKFGILFQQEGRWDGRQVIPAEWVRRSTAVHSQVGDQGYGYLWWHQWFSVPTAAGDRRVDMVVATGNGGQKIYLVPSLDLIAVFTGGAYNVDSSPPNAVMRTVLLPALLAAGQR
ncbi:serine hydrolase domain-containing protein [Longimicrobium sp.]|uniref:serine hydrolase domain-containing protein n=1 Tax=Longimicrobium sp. TaxID=2029185 RepID=UPI003B3BD67E